MSTVVTTANARQVLSGFKHEVVGLVLTALEDGGFNAQLSNNGHVILRHPDGRTTSLSRSLGVANRGWQNAVASVFREASTDHTSTAYLVGRYGPRIALGILVAGDLGFTLGVNAIGDVVLTQPETGRTIRVTKKMTQDQLMHQVTKLASADARLGVLSISPSDWEAHLRRRFDDGSFSLQATPAETRPAKQRKPRHGETQKAQETQETQEAQETSDMLASIADTPAQAFDLTDADADVLSRGDAPDQPYITKDGTASTTTVIRARLVGGVEHKVYGCLGCSYVSDSAVSVAAHYKRKVDAAHPHSQSHKSVTAVTLPVVPMEEITVTEPEPETVGEQPEPVREQPAMADAVYRASDGGTAEDILFKVRLLVTPVSHDEMTSRVQELTRAVEDLTEQVARLEAELADKTAMADACAVLAQETEDRLNALKELVAGM